MAKAKLKDNPFKGFKKLMIRDVPPGSIISSDTAENFPLKESGSFISEDKNLTIQPEANGQWRLIPNNSTSMARFISLWDQVKGDEGFINMKVKEWYGPK